MSYLFRVAAGIIVSINFNLTHLRATLNDYPWSSNVPLQYQVRIVCRVSHLRARCKLQYSYLTTPPFVTILRRL